MKSPIEILEAKSLTDLFKYRMSSDKKQYNLSSLNQQLADCPGNIGSRLKRAKIYLNQDKYAKALEDYTYVYKKYLAKIEASKGIKICNQNLVSRKFESFAKK